MNLDAPIGLTLRVVATRLAVGCAFAFALFLLAGPSFAHAQATRTWVSGVGDDANPCSRTAPCKTFAGAISKTAAAGEIDALDPGGFGVVTITKSITIDASPQGGGILAALSNGVIVNAGANDVVVLRGLSIQGVGNGLNGVRFINGAALFVEDCVINGFTQTGIDFEPTASATLFVTNTNIRDNGTSGIIVKPGAGASGRASIAGTRLENNAVGLNARTSAHATISDSVASKNSVGLLAVTAGGAPDAEIVAESVVVNLNDVGLRATGGGTATIRMSNLTIVDNTTGIDAAAGSIVQSFLNNRIAGNVTDGAPTTTKAQE